mmetsp:Transcript_11973/g.13784  ORF Transcript_11973/g.13784 Transcript_11973/m.13784 type:complete len:296 (+) Transcript_11973:114-1001(+)|eukprot:CAMPEP_0184005712 /NCGR_PEP_ID=MMETSP0954-20121128/223_1 /TAXON_ID=627963 /ORGANISM="Aplanochytrium sp, Strain PBS07" /LENGTH=295 /DNA_ID=CAMNT_0026284047 /DNA_START=1779 /DNA_END=2666 /DNA_ORIENTATION=+
MVGCNVNKFIREIAFPFPQEPVEFYNEVLSSRKDFLWLNVGKGQRVPALYIKGGRSLTAKYTVLYSHGNGEDLGVDVEYLVALQRYIGVDLFAYDYVGYSLSRFEPGNNTPSVSGCNRSIKAAWNYLTKEAGIPAKDIIIYGRSLGSGPSLYLARKYGISKKAEKRCAGVVLQSPIASAIRAAVGPKLASCCICFDFYRNYSFIHKLRCRVGIMHGTEDEVVPVNNGELLHSRLKNPHEPLWLEGYGHNDINAEDSFAYVKGFVDAIKQERRGVMTKEDMRKKRLENLKQGGPKE